MRSSVTHDFRQRLAALPAEVQDQARRAYIIWRVNAYHRSMEFKRVSRRQPIYSARVGIGYRALGLLDDNHIFWFWIGPHAEYDELLKRL